MPQDSGDHQSPPDDSTQVVAEYSVFWKKTAPQKRILLLQFPSRYSDQPFNLAHYNKPSEIRIKPRSGLVEIDVPVHIGRRYDISKGTKFATALKESRARRTGFLPGKGEYGLAGGFGINAHLHGRATRSSIGRDADGMDLEDGGSDSYLHMLTLGGRLRMFKRGDPIYTIGIFRGDELHLSKVDGICSLQPQFHHLDAIADNDRVSSRVAAGAENQTAEPEARAVNLTVKSTDQEQIDVNDVDRALREMQEEPWQCLDWIDESDGQAIVSFENDLMLTGPDQATNLVSSMTENQYLDAISAPRIDPTRQGKRVMISRQWEEGTEEAILEEEDQHPRTKSTTPKTKVEPD